MLNQSQTTGMLVLALPNAITHSIDPPDSEGKEDLFHTPILDENDHTTKKQFS